MSTTAFKRAMQLLDAPKPAPVIDLSDLIEKAKKQLKPAGMKPVHDRKYSYTNRHRGEFFAPEYDFEEIQIAQDVDGYMFRSIQKKVNRIIVAGWDLVGADPTSVKYIARRLAEISWATGVPFDELIESTFHDMFRFSNCAWVKARNRDSSSGRVRSGYDGVLIEPVAGYFIMPFETLRLKTRANGELKKVQQCMPDGETKEFSPKDIVHFYTNRKPGFSVGTPELLPALDDVALLRRIEENVEDLIEANLFPVFHYKIGSDKMPERYTPDGVKETDIVKATIEYMPAGGVYVSDHRHEIVAVGSEGRALRIDSYLGHFKARALASLGTSSIDMGEGGDATRSTASTLSKGMLLDIEAMSKIVKRFIEFKVISELLLEGGFDPLDKDQMVHIRFGIIDKDERRADENQQIQLFSANLRTIDEVRETLGDEPWTPEHTERTFHKMYGEPTALLKSLTPGSAASETLAKHESSNITPEAVNKEKTFAKEQQKAQAASKATGRPVTKNGAAASSSAKAKPSNQHGQRSSPKTTHDVVIADLDGNEYTVACDTEVSADTIEMWKGLVYTRYSAVADLGVSFQSVANNLSWRLRGSN